MNRHIRISPHSGKSVLLAFAMSVAMIAAGSPAVSAQDQDVSEVTAAMNGLMLATLEATYTVTYHHTEENMIFKDNIYYQKDLARIDYGFKFVKPPKIVRDGDSCILAAAVRASDFRPKNRETVIRQSTDGEMRLKNKDGNYVDVDQIMNGKVLEEEKKFRAEHMEIARSKMNQLFGIYAAKYGCVPELDFVK